MPTIPVLADVIAPNSLWSSKVRGRVMRSNKRAQNVGGFAQVNVRRSRSLRQYEFGTVPMLPDVWRSLEGLYEVTDAGAYGFLLLDPKDSVVPKAFGRVVTYESSDSSYRLVMRKTAAGSARTHDRYITRPIAAEFILYVNNVEEASYTLDDTTGVIIIPGDPDPTTVSWAGRTYVPVHFENDDIDWDLVVAGPAGSRLMAGPRISLLEVRE